jgi:hypothetical protein
MNILEYGKEEWKKIDWAIIPILIYVEFGLWIVFFFLEIDGSFWASLRATAVIAGVAVVLYLLARLLYKSYLILAGREWKSGNKTWAMDGVRRTRRQEKLIEIALKSPLATVRIEAVKRVVDQAFLKKVVITDSSSHVCEAAWERITNRDQEFLKDVALHAPVDSFRVASVGEISDEDFLQDRAINDPNNNVRVVAIKKIRDQEFLKDVALHAPVDSFRVASVGEISDENFLQDRAINDPNKYVRAAAITKITTDQGFLQDRAINDPDSVVRAAAVKNITRPDFLLKRGINDPSWEVSRAAFKRLMEGSMDEVLLQALVSTLAGELKGMFNDVTVKRDCASYLHAIYKRHPDSSTRKTICELDGTRIYEGTNHTDWGRHTDDECGYLIHIDHSDNANHTDYPGEPAEYFSVKQTL